MNYCVNPDFEPNYLEIKNKFSNLKNTELKNTIPHFNILVLNDRYSSSKGKFLSQREKYLNKIINIFLIMKNGIEQIIGPILITDERIIFDIMDYINNFIPSENVYLDKQENLHIQINNYYNIYFDNANTKTNNVFTNIMFDY
jgi:hypothetical protein